MQFIGMRASLSRPGRNVLLTVCWLTRCSNLTNPIFKHEILNLFWENISHTLQCFSLEAFSPSMWWPISSPRVDLLPWKLQTPAGCEVWAQRWKSLPLEKLTSSDFTNCIFITRDFTFWRENIFGASPPPIETQRKNAFFARQLFFPAPQHQWIMKHN